MDTEREIELLWERVNMLADERATKGQVLKAREVAATRHLDLVERLETALDNAADYRKSLEARLDGFARAVEHEFMRQIEAPPKRSFWDHFKGWG